jgi:hypothetical protein
LAVAETPGGTYGIVAEFNGNQVRSLKIDRTSGLLSLVGSVSLPNGPSALAVSPGAQVLLATTLHGNNVMSYAIDRSTGALSPIDAVPTGGNGPVNLDISNGGFAVIANKDSNGLGVVKIDPNSGLLTLVGSVAVGNAPNDVKITGRRVVVGHAISNDVHLLRLDRFGALYPLDVKPAGAGTSRVTSMAVHGRDVVAGTFDGLVHYYRIRSDQLFPRGVYDTGGDITDITIVKGGPLNKTLLVAGGIPNRVTAFELDGDELVESGSLLFPGAPTSRTLATTRGWRRVTYVLVNEFQGNQTWVIAAQPSDREEEEEDEEDEED